MKYIYLSLAVLVSPVFAEEFKEMDLAVMCKFEARQFDDAREAMNQDGDPDTFTDAEKEYREQLMDELKTDFETLTGENFDIMSDKWLNHILKHGNPC